MEAKFQLTISIQTTEGPQRIGHFELGNKRDAARSLFRSLKCSPEVSPKDMLYIELMELFNGLPINIDMVTCDLQQLGLNTMLVTQELFRLANLKGK